MLKVPSPPTHVEPLPELIKYDGAARVPGVETLTLLPSLLLAWPVPAMYNLEFAAVEVTVAPPATLRVLLEDPSVTTLTKTAPLTLATLLALAKEAWLLPPLVLLHGVPVTPVQLVAVVSQSPVRVGPFQVPTAAWAAGVASSAVRGRRGDRGWRWAGWL